jgi:hypothetical protein
MLINRFLIFPFFKKEEGMFVRDILKEIVTQASLFFSRRFEHTGAEFDHFGPTFGFGAEFYRYYFHRIMT